MICKAQPMFGPSIQHCRLPAVLATPLEERHQCPDCGTWYQAKQFGRYGAIWIALPKGTS